jgi:hypothetical protein
MITTALCFVDNTVTLSSFLVLEGLLLYRRRREDDDGDLFFSLLDDGRSHRFVLSRCSYRVARKLRVKTLERTLI